MPAGTRQRGPTDGGILDLLSLAAARPDEALAQAQAILAADPAPYDASVAHQALGMLQREFGDLDAATGELRSALRLARAAGSGDRQADVLATLGVALIYRGQSGRGSRRSAPRSGWSRARRRAASSSGGASRCGFWGRHREALDDLRRAARAPRSATDPIWEARTLTSTN